MDELLWIAVVVLAGLAVYWSVRGCRHLEDLNDSGDLGFGPFVLLLLQTGPIAVLYWLLFSRARSSEAKTNVDR